MASRDFLLAVCVCLLLSAGSNAAMLKLSNCTQSSNPYGQGKCNLAIDGNTNQNWNGKSITHTSDDQHPWWQARTEAPALIKQVRIYNRQDCCAERLNNFVIKVDGHICARYNSKASFSVRTFDCHHEGSIVRIESTVKTFLSLAEVQVFGSIHSKHFTRLGCAKDKHNDREMTTIIDAGSLTSHEYCVQHCNSTGHKYAALQNGQFCQCGDSYGRHGMAGDADCATKCKGQVHETCGGTFRNEIFDASIGGTDTVGQQN